MLELRPSCEQCNVPLPADSDQAMICSYECTFCHDCVVNVLEDVCPNCGGGFVARPIRPATNLRGNNYLGRHPASTKVVHKPVDPEEHRRFAATVKHIAPAER